MEKFTEKDRDFFEKPAEELAEALLGQVICHEVSEKGEEPFTIKYRITHTEAYPFDDPATDHNPVQALQGGHLYIMHKRGETYWRFDVVANKEGVSESVLIAGVDPYGHAPNNAFWALDLEPKFDQIDLLKDGSPIWLEKRTTKKPESYRAKRKGLNKDCPTKDAQLQFIIKELEF